MRVVAGSARGRRLRAPQGNGTRPTTDRVREAMFNALGSLAALEGARVLDLFGGSGALSVEALSRGAAHATIIEHQQSARSIIDHNLVATGFTDRSDLLAGDGVAHLPQLARTGRRFDLILLDPPHPFDAWPDLLRAVVAVLAPGGHVVIESDRAVDTGPVLSVIREKRYGSTVVAIARAPMGEMAPSGEHA